MTRQQRDRSLGDGVYFAHDDYIGLSTRLVIWFVDAVVLLLIMWGLAVL